MMTSLTRDEFITYLYHIETAAYTQAYKEKILDHDQAQRAVIASFEELTKMNGEEITKLVTENKTLREALQSLLKHYIGLVECGDCGNWDPYEESVVKQAQQALKEGSSS